MYNMYLFDNNKATIMSVFLVIHGTCIQHLLFTYIIFKIFGPILRLGGGEFIHQQKKGQSIHLNGLSDTLITLAGEGNYLHLYFSYNLRTDSFVFPKYVFIWYCLRCILTIICTHTLVLLNMIVTSSIIIEVKITMQYTIKLKIDVHIEMFQMTFLACYFQCLV